MVILPETVPNVICEPHFLKEFDMSVTASEPWSRDLERLVRESLKSIRFGTVTLVIQDGRVIQVDKNEKIRMDKVGYIHGGGI